MRIVLSDRIVQCTALDQVCDACLDCIASRRNIGLPLILERADINVQGQAFPRDKSDQPSENIFQNIQTGLFGTPIPFQNIIHGIISNEMTLIEDIFLAVGVIIQGRLGQIEPGSNLLHAAAMVTGQGQYATRGLHDGTTLGLVRFRAISEERDVHTPVS